MRSAVGIERCRASGSETEDFFGVFIDDSADGVFAQTEVVEVNHSLGDTEDITVSTSHHIAVNDHALETVFPNDVGDIL